jgi:hypothetical protein
VQAGLFPTGSGLVWIVWDWSSSDTHNKVDAFAYSSAKPPTHQPPTARCASVPLPIAPPSSISRSPSTRPSSTRPGSTRSSSIRPGSSSEKIPHTTPQSQLQPPDPAIRVANARTLCMHLQICQRRRKFAHLLHPNPHPAIEVATARISVHLSHSILIQWSIPHVSALDLVPSPVGHSGDVEGCCLSLLG